MRERAWIWRQGEEVPGLRKPRPSSLFGPSGPARQRAMEAIVPNIPAAWAELPADDADVLGVRARRACAARRKFATLAPQWGGPGRRLETGMSDLGSAARA